MNRAAQHYQRMAHQAERFYSESGIGDSRAYDRLASMERAHQIRRQVLDFALGMAAGIALLFLMAAL